MKKLHLILVSCLFTLFSYSQVPSINTNTNFSKERGEYSDQNKIDNLFKRENKLKDELDKISKPLGKEEAKLNKLKTKLEDEINEEKIKTLNEEIKKTEVEISKLKSKSEAINDKLKSIRNDLKTEGEKPENNFFKPYNDHYDLRIEKLDVIIAKLNKDLDEAKKEENTDRMDNYKNEIKDLNRKKTNLLIEKGRVLSPKVNHYQWYFPTWKPKYRNSFFEDVYNNPANKTNYLNAFSIVGAPNGITGQSELIADNIKMVRVTFGTVISASNDSLTNANTQVEALQRLINGGGNFYLDGSLPLMNTIKGNSDSELVNLYSFLTAKIASDVKGYGNDLEASTFNSSMGLNCYGDLSSENKKFNFFFVAYTNYYFGSTKEFYRNLGIEHNHGFLSGKVTIGVTMLNQFRFSANVLTFGSEPGVRSDKIGFGLQFLPNL